MIVTADISNILQIDHLRVLSGLQQQRGFGILLLPDPIEYIAKLVGRNRLDQIMQSIHRKRFDRMRSAGRGEHHFCPWGYFPHLPGRIHAVFFREVHIQKGNGKIRLLLCCRNQISD